jgi:hypothetical protein
MDMDITGQQLIEQDVSIQPNIDELSQGIVDAVKSLGRAAVQFDRFRNLPVVNAGQQSGEVLGILTIWQWTSELEG